jgi:CubicO group peptidase (beta-lactamase class C family)
MRFRTSSRLVASTLFCATILAGGPLVAVEPQEELAGKVDAIFAQLAKPGSPGCALAVVRDGGIVYEKGYGLASLENGVPVDPKRTVFDIGSTSKQFTAASILLLARDGKLSLDDEIHKYVPELPDYGAPITLRNLLHHTSGLRDYINLMVMGDFTIQDLTTDDDALAVLARQKKLNFAPGSEFTYSNSGYFLLSLVVKRASGKSLRDFAQERIFTPLGMTDTQYVNDHAAVVLHRATGYRPQPDGSFGVEMSNWEQNGDGGVNTTVEDLAKWDRNFYDPKVGGPWLIEQLQITGKLNNGESIEYARGLAVSTYRGLRRISHDGSWAGYRAELMRFPDQKLSVIALCNLATAVPNALAQQVADLYLGDRLAPVPAASSPVAAATPLDPARYTGLYWSPLEGLVRRIVVRDGKVFYVRSTSESELRFLGDDRFEMRDAVGTTVVFTPAAAGSQRRMQLVTGTAKPLVFEEEQPPAPLQPADLAAYAGTYASPTAPPICSSGVVPGEPVLQATSKVGTVVDGGTQQAIPPNVWLTDQSGQLVRYEIRVDRDSFDYIVGNGFYNGSTQDALPAAFNFPTGADGGPLGAIEIKAAWKVLGPKDDAKRFFTEEVTIVDTRVDIATGRPARQGVFPTCNLAGEGPCCKRTMGLVGFHIAHKVKGRPQWVWSTFEQVDNAPIQGATPDPKAHYSFNDPTCTGCIENGNPHLMNAPMTTPVQVARTTRVDIPLLPKDVNDQWHQIVRGSVWENYVLVSTQWPAAPQGAVDDDHQPTPEVLSNTMMETYIQNGDKETASCLKCHSFASGLNGCPGDFSFLLGKAQPRPATHERHCGPAS